MYQILYISRANHLMNDDELNVILKEARERNKHFNITGMLLYIEGAFIQILEGEKQQVTSILKLIKKDSRHHNLFILGENTMTKRYFPNWEMAFHQLHNAEINDYPIIKQLLQNKQNPALDVTQNTSLINTFLSLAAKVYSS